MTGSNRVKYMWGGQIWYKIYHNITHEWYMSIPPSLVHIGIWTLLCLYWHKYHYYHTGSDHMVFVLLVDKIWKQESIHWTYTKDTFVQVQWIWGELTSTEKTETNAGIYLQQRSKFRLSVRPGQPKQSPGTQKYWFSCPMDNHRSKGKTHLCTGIF